MSRMTVTQKDRARVAALAWRQLQEERPGVTVHTLKRPSHQTWERFLAGEELPRRLGSILDHLGWDYSDYQKSLEDPTHVPARKQPSALGLEDSQFVRESITEILERVRRIEAREDAFEDEAHRGRRASGDDESPPNGSGSQR